MSEAASRFWGIPELVEKFLDHLDLNTLLTFIKAYRPGVALLQKQVVWSGLIKRLLTEVKGWDSTNPSEVSFEEYTNGLMADLHHLVELVQLVHDDGGATPLLDTLHLICQGFPGWREEYVRVSCSCSRGYHEVASLGFQILEAIQGQIFNISIFDGKVSVNKFL